MINHISKSNLILLVVLSLSALYLFGRFNCGWIPHDEGAVAHAAERVLEGELPHRDFDDVYTGGLSFFHALAFLVFGLRLLSLRLVLLFLSLAFIAAVYRIASRTVSPIIAGFITLLCLGWSLPNYFAGLPSWYNLFFAIFGAFTLFKYIETNAKYWLFITGFFGGLSFLFKLTGLYYVAAVILFLIYREQIMATAATRDYTHSKGFPLVMGMALLIFGVILIFLVFPFLSFMVVLYFLVPSFTLIGFLLWSERKLGCGYNMSRWQRLAGLIMPFISGVIAPILVFIIPYLFSSSVGDLFRGIFILPANRLQFTVYPLPSASTLVTTLPLSLLLIAPFFKKHWLGERYLVIAIIAISGLLIIFGDNVIVYRAFLHSIRLVLPLAIIVGCLFLSTPVSGDELNSSKRQQMFLVLSMSGVMNLTQFPFSLYIYYCYIAPLVILTIIFIITAQKGSPRKVWICFGVCYLLFSLIWLNQSYVLSEGMKFIPLENNMSLRLERGGLKVSKTFAQLYCLLVSRVQQHSSPGDYIYASPDCPEVYFLCDRKNPTRTLFDFFDTDFKRDPQGRINRILALIEERKINVVVIRWRGDFSGWSNPDFLREIEFRFPNRCDLQMFTLFWREGEAIED